MHESTFRQVRLNASQQARLTHLLGQQRLTGREEAEMMALAVHAPQRLRDQASQRQARRRANRERKAATNVTKPAGGKKGDDDQDDFKSLLDL